MPVASKRLRHTRRLKRQNTLLYRALIEQGRQLEYAKVLMQQMTNAADLTKPVDPPTVPVPTAPPTPPAPAPKPDAIVWGS